MLLKTTVKKAIRSLIPLSTRMRIAIWVQNRKWINSHRRSWWTVELIRDLAERDVNAYHKFLWTHHLAYAAPYEAETRFGPQNMRPSRQLFFSELLVCLDQIGVRSEEIGSVLEVGCSLGYQLRFVETDVFPGAAVLDGVDIDAYAIRSGEKYLADVGSKISLKHGDIQQLEDLLGGRTYDVIICAGVLMYLKETDAGAIVRWMLSHSRIVVAMAGLAHPDHDNSELDHSDIRGRDETFIHNFDDLVKRADGKVLARRWEGDRLVEGQSIYFVFAATN